jgi:hypothetical protein
LVEICRIDVAKDSSMHSSCDRKTR